MTVVLDSSALITLARVGRLHRIADVVHVPNAVFEEVVQKGAGRPGSVEVAQARWILRRDARDLVSVERLGARVGRGERKRVTQGQIAGYATSATFRLNRITEIGAMGPGVTPMKFGLYSSIANPPRVEHLERAIDEVIAEAQLAEYVGFDSCFFGEHHQDKDGFLPSPHGHGHSKSARP